MASLNIRDVDGDLVHRLKIASAREGITLKDYVLRALTKAVRESRVLLPREKAEIGISQR